MRFGITDTPIVAAPDPLIMAAGRVSANKAQILHDLNLALLLFFEDNAAGDGIRRSVITELTTQ